MTYKSFQRFSFFIVSATFVVIQTDATGYSYAKFVGPLRGPERKVFLQGGGRSTVDFVAIPEYQYAYGVEDAKSGVLQNHRETRSGDAVRGLYSVVDPDGKLRVVKYKADDINGFQAEVITDGVSTFHGQEPSVLNSDYQNVDGYNVIRPNVPNNTPNVRNSTPNILANVNHPPLQQLVHHTQLPVRNTDSLADEKQNEDDNYEDDDDGDTGNDASADGNYDEKSEDIDEYDDSDDSVEGKDDGNEYEEE